MKINTLQIENVKRVKAVALSPTQNGLTVIGGRNGQGKTSVLDAIAVDPEKLRDHALFPGRHPADIARLRIAPAGDEKRLRRGRCRFW